LLRHDTNAEILGIVQPVAITPDMILARVADDPEVLEAGKRWDRATPETYPPLIGARSAAQARLGIVEAEQALLYSGEVEEHLVPVVMKLATDAERATELRQKFRRLCGAYAERVLVFCLRTYQHGNIDGLKRAAGVA
jgi:hypothetical protein